MAITLGKEKETRDAKTQHYVKVCKESLKEATAQLCCLLMRRLNKKNNGWRGCFSLRRVVPDVWSDPRGETDRLGGMPMRAGQVSL
jgi:hypothetical protein